MWVIKQRGIILRTLSTHKIISLLIVKRQFKIIINTNLCTNTNKTDTKENIITENCIKNLKISENLNYRQNVYPEQLYTLWYLSNR